MSSINKTVEQMRNELNKKSATAHPIKNHPLAKCDEYVKKLYIDMLCMVAQYENANADKAMKFIERIMAGVGLTEPVAEHIKNSMEITYQKLEEFINQSEENNIQIIFLTDCFILAGFNSAPNKKQVEFITEIAKITKLRKTVVLIISKIAKSILMQSNDEYLEACKDIEDGLIYPLLTSVACYTKEFVNGVLVDCHALLWISYKEKTALSLPKELIEKKLSYSNYSNKERAIYYNTIIIENLIYDKAYEVAADSLWLVCGNINFINCDFINDSYIYLKISGNARFEGCNVQGEHTKLCIDTAEEILFEKCNFNKVNSKKEGRYIIHIGDAKLFKISDCEFGNISFYNKKQGLVKFEPNQDGMEVYVYNCKFKRFFAEVVFLLAYKYNYIKRYSMISIYDCEFINCNIRKPLVLAEGFSNNHIYNNTMENSWVKGDTYE